MRSFHCLKSFGAIYGPTFFPVHFSPRMGLTNVSGGVFSNFYQCIRFKSLRYARKAIGVYVPKSPGVIPARESLAKLPVVEKPADTGQQRSRTSGEIFKSVMGDIFTSKSKYLIAVEGARQVDDAIAFGLRAKMLFISKSLPKLPENVKKLVKGHEAGNSFETNSSRPEIHRLNFNTIQEWSSVQTPPGIIGIFEKPKNPVQVQNSKLLLPLTVVLDNVRDPGNLGSIIRTAAGIGCKVILSEGCADPWETKCLRGGNGAHFFVPLKSKVDLQCIQQHIPLAESASIITDDSGLSNSTNKGGVGIFLADIGSGPDDHGISILDYTSIQYSKFNSTMLILGGETTGISTDTKKAVLQLSQYYPEDIKLISRIRIPMCLPIDSLNVANSFGIIGYEILRQYSSAIPSLCK